MTQAIDIAADRAICEAATPGSWRQSQNNEWRVLNDRGMLIGDAQLLDNTIFIAAARTRWPAALDEIERLRATLAEREATIGELRHLLTLMSNASAIYHAGKDDTIERLSKRADALLAKTAPPKEGT